MKLGFVVVVKEENPKTNELTSIEMVFSVGRPEMWSKNHLFVKKWRFLHVLGATLKS